MMRFIRLMVLCILVLCSYQAYVSYNSTVPVAAAIEHREGFTSISRVEADGSDTVLWRKK